MAILDAFIPGEYRAPLLGQGFSVFCVLVGLPGKRIESLTGLWTLTLYLMLGIVPLWLRQQWHCL